MGWRHSCRFPYGCVRVICYSMISLIGSLAGVSRSNGQSPDGKQELPSPLFIAGVPVPSGAIDWDRYIVEECSAAVERVLFSSRIRSERDTLGDTVFMHGRDPRWIPLAPAVIQTGRQCIRHLHVPQLPDLALSSALQLAVAADADSFAQAIIARQLTQAHGTRATIAVLVSAIEALLNAQEHFTQAHIQLARAYATKIDSIVPGELEVRIKVREAFIAPAVAANDVETQLQLELEIQRILQNHLPNATLKDSSVIFQQAFWLPMTIAGLRWLQSMSHRDLQSFAAIRNRLGKKANHGDTLSKLDLFGEPAIPIHGDYCYHTIGHADPLVPAPGQISVLFFEDNTRDGSVGDQAYAFDLLHRIHQTYPTVAFTLVTQTVGTYGGQILVDHPEREAGQLSHYYVDTLGWPGAVCIIKSTFQRTPGGHVSVLPYQIREAYGFGPSGSHFVVVDPTGTIVNYDWWNIRNPYNDGIDLLDFFRRLQKRSKAVSDTTVPRGHS